MDSEGVLLPLIHEHRMLPWNDLRKGDCCGRLEAISDGYFCKSCDFFVHKKCSDIVPESIEHPLHPDHTLQLHSRRSDRCRLCQRDIVDLFYSCDKCFFDIDLVCAKYPPPEVIDISETHHHKLTLLKKSRCFYCDAAKCVKFPTDQLPYKCHECDLVFHISCVWHGSEVNKHPLEVNHPHHSLHPLKLFTGRIPDYCDGKCRLCGTEIDDRLFYHCSSCNFTVDMRCVLNPPQRSLLNLKAHDHQLTLLPRLDSFTCIACGLKGDRTPYACFHCGFMIHQDCLDLPRLININRHDHRVSRTSVLGVMMNSVCGVCRQKVDWTCGGYSCVRCPGYVVHSKCATRKDVWNGKELEGVPEEDEDIAPYVVIDDNTIKHFSHRHREHYLRLHDNGDENKRCRACTYPISLQSFYSCIHCDFNLHKYCAEFPTKKWHMLHNERLTLVTSETNCFRCRACDRDSNGFRYQDRFKNFDVICCSISEPFVHPSHPNHPLYYTTAEGGTCNGCGDGMYMLRCLENGCGFVICFKCATLPQVVKHRVDDHHLSLCYGEKASGIYWCDICERKTNPNKWFYTCKDHRASLHTKCVLGDLFGPLPGRTEHMFGRREYEVVLNNSVSRPFCSKCKSHCMYPIMLKLLGTSDTYICSLSCT